MDDILRKETEKFLMEKVALVVGVSDYFNHWLGYLMGIIEKEKYSKDYLLNTLNEFKENVFYLMEQSDEWVISDKLDDMFSRADEYSKVPFSSFLYSKFTIVFSVFHDALEAPISENEKNEVRDNLLINMKYFIEILFDFVDKWDSTMSREEVQQLVFKIGKDFNRKYDKKGFELYS